MIVIKLLYFLIVLTIIIVCDDTDDKVVNCVKNNNNNARYNFENYLSTKSPYRIVANYKNFSKIQYPGCKPEKLWGLVRHGTRNPSVKLIEKMRTRLPEIRDLILENVVKATNDIHNTDLDSFRKWSTKLTDDDAKKLTHEGEDEMLQLAERLQARFPDILDHIYSNTSYKFKFTATQRTKKSAQYFAAGLFGKRTVRDIDYPLPSKRDPILRFYKLCNKWRKDIRKNASTLIERKRFESDSIVVKAIKDINRRLGLNADHLNLADVHTMYVTCAFETAWNKRTKSPWCSPFTVNDLRAFEYAEDLKYYWVDGYGHELTYKQACPAFTDMIDFFENKNRFPKTNVYFTHSGTLLKMLAHLELYKDNVHLMADNYRAHLDRKWRVSQIDTFGTNLVFVLFNCKDGQKMLTFHQERIVRLPSCPNADLCDFEVLKRYYSDSVENCDFDEMCDNNINL